MSRDVRLLVFAGLLLFGVFINVRAAFCEHLSASGCSVSNLGYLSDIAKEFEAETGIKMFVRGGGSIVGLADLRAGNVDFAASCRGKEADDPDDVELIQVAWDALVFMVHKSNPVEDISTQDVKGIYFGEITRWNQLNGDDEPIIKVLVKPSKSLSGVEQSLRSLLLEGKEIIKTPNTVIHTSAAIVEQAVETTPNGFGTSGFSSARKRNVKMLNFNGIVPTKENIAANRYPLKRPLYLALRKNPKPEARKFVDFVLSSKGQKLISSYGMVSLKDVK